MRPQELRIIKEFNKILHKVEDNAMTVISNKISKYTDKEAYKRYTDIQKLSEDFSQTLDKIQDLEDFKKYAKEYESRYDSLIDALNSFDSYFTNKSDFSKKVMKIAIDIAKKDTDKMHLIIGSAKYLNYHKTANNLRFQMKKLTDIMAYFINMTINETIEGYKQLLSENSIQLNEKNKQKTNMLKALILEKYKEADDGLKFKKILDCRKMDNLMKELGYEEIRQKGSHKIYSDGCKSIPVPQHAKLNKGLAYGIQKQARI